MALRSLLLSEKAHSRYVVVQGWSAIWGLLNTLQTVSIGVGLGSCANRLHFQSGIQQNERKAAMGSRHSLSRGPKVLWRGFVMLRNLRQNDECVFTISIKCTRRGIGALGSDGGAAATPRRRRERHDAGHHLAHRAAHDLVTKHEATPRMTWRAVARSAIMEMRCMMRAFTRDRPPSSLLNPSLRWCCAAICVCVRDTLFGTKSRTSQ